MKKVLLAGAAAVLLATSATAGGMAPSIEPIMPDTDVSPASSSSAGLIIPLILIALVAAALSSGGSND